MPFVGRAEVAAPTVCAVGIGTHWTHEGETHPTGQKPRLVQKLLVPSFAVRKKDGRSRPLNVISHIRLPWFPAEGVL